MACDVSPVAMFFGSVHRLLFTNPSPFPQKHITTTSTRCSNFLRKHMARQLVHSFAFSYIHSAMNTCAGAIGHNVDWISFDDSLSANRCHPIFQSSAVSRQLLSIVSQINLEELHYEN